MSRPRGSPLPPVDHLAWGGRNLELEIERFEAWTGVRAVPGGRHPGAGTWNALIGLGPDTYLELIAPDSTQAAAPQSHQFGLDTLSEPCLITWAVKARDLDQRAAAARAAGVELGEVRQGRRELANGQLLSWRLTAPRVAAGRGLVPFLIDWGESPHPAKSAPGGLRLVALRAEHQDPAELRRQMRALGLELEVVAGPAPALIATLDTHRGRIELR
jgi:Glyoxalase-like domain